MNGLLIAGAGGHGKVVADCAQQSRLWGAVAFLDDRFPELSSVLAWPVIGPLAVASTLLHDYPYLVVALGDNELRVRLIRRYQAEGFKIPIVVHPTATVSAYASVSPGSVICPHAVVNAGTSLADGVIVNTGALIDHDCCIGTGVHVSPGAKLGGGVAVGDNSWIGMGATVLPRKTIGSGAVVGAGAVVTSDIPDAVTAMGVPARIVKKHGTSE